MIHKTAIIHKNAKLAKGVSVGPNTIIGEDVLIGQNTQIGANCVVDGHTTIGPDCEIFTGAVIGSSTQDKKFKGEKAFLEIGARNKIREYVTINLSTSSDSKTTLGDDNLLMAYSHIAHDCKVGSRVILANVCTLGGHVIVEDGAVLGGLSAVHQFCRIGSLAIIGGCSKVVQDIVPYALCDGHPAKIHGINSIGMTRAKMAPDAKAVIKSAFKILFRMGLNVKTAVDKIRSEIPQTKEIQHLIEFINSSERGISM